MEDKKENRDDLLKDAADTAGEEILEEKAPEKETAQKNVSDKDVSDKDVSDENVSDENISDEDVSDKDIEDEKETQEGGPEEVSEGEAGDDGAEESAEGGKKGFFKKKEKKKDKKDEKIEELTDQVKRQMAEFDNFRKRTEKEKTQMFETGAKSIIEKVLPVVDNFERGLAAVPEENKDDAFVDGMNKVYKQMMAMLEEAGVTPIEAVGKEFDPNLHNAVMQTESEEFESGIVAQELQKGYLYRDSVVRHSMVAVVS